MACDYLNFDFNKVFPKVGGWAKLIGLATKNDGKGSEKASREGTMFYQWEIDAARRLFKLAKRDENARAFLAKVVAWADDRARVVER